MTLMVFSRELRLQDHEAASNRRREAFAAHPDMRELILLFHGLGEPHSLVDEEEARYWWDPASFAQLLDQLIERQERLPAKVRITFDDGNASDALLALPELSKRGLNAEFFICAGRVGKKHYLDKPMIRDLLTEGMSVGSHGMDHRDWRTLDAAALDIEINDARRRLEDITEHPVTAVAIPFGSYDRRVLGRLKRESWDCIYTSDGGTTQSGSTTKPRETVTNDMQGQDILTRLSVTPPIRIKARRILARLYKQLRGSPRYENSIF